MDSLHLNNQLCFPIYALSRQMTALYRPHLDKMGLTYPQYLVMLALWEHETVSVKKLGNLLWLDSGTLTPLLKRMEENELLTRSRSKTDERVVNISLSDKGKNLRDSAKGLPDLLKQQLENDGVQLEQLRAQLQQLLAVTTAQCKL